MIEAFFIEQKTYPFLIQKSWFLFPLHSKTKFAQPIEEINKKM